MTVGFGAWALSLLATSAWLSPGRSLVRALLVVAAVGLAITATWRTQTSAGVLPSGVGKTFQRTAPRRCRSGSPASPCLLAVIIVARAPWATRWLRGLLVGWDGGGGVGRASAGGRSGGERRASARARGMRMFVAGRAAVTVAAATRAIRDQDVQPRSTDTVVADDGGAPVPKPIWRADRTRRGAASRRCRSSWSSGTQVRH